MNKQFMKLSNGKKLAYKIYGNGEETVVLFHGLIGSAILTKDAIMQIEKYLTNMYTGYTIWV